MLGAATTLRRRRLGGWRRRRPRAAMASLEGGVSPLRKQGISRRRGPRGERWLATACQKKYAALDRSLTSRGLSTPSSTHGRALRDAADRARRAHARLPRAEPARPPQEEGGEEAVVPRAGHGDDAVRPEWPLHWPLRGPPAVHLDGGRRARRREGRRGRRHADAERARRRCAASGVHSPTQPTPMPLGARPSPLASPAWQS